MTEIISRRFWQILSLSEKIFIFSTLQDIKERKFFIFKKLKI